MALKPERCRKMIDTVARQLASVVPDFADAELMLAAVQNSMTADPYLRGKCSQARSLLKTAIQADTDDQRAHWLYCARLDVAVVRMHLPAPKDVWS